MRLYAQAMGSGVGIYQNPGNRLIAIRTGQRLLAWTVYTGRVLHGAHEARAATKVEARDYRALEGARYGSGR